MKYTHIFTDGLDKLLSASIWFPFWGDKTSFVYYENNELKGYIAQESLRDLGLIGEKNLRDKKFIEELFNKSEEIQKQSLLVQKEANAHLAFKLASKLLQDGYTLYFNTEEYVTENLDPIKDGEIIDKIGKYRFDFVQVCVALTNIVYELAEKISSTKKDVQFFTYSEIIDKYFNKKSLTDRQKAFLLQKNENGFSLLEGELAKQKFTELVEINNTEILHGRGASPGEIEGKIFKVSVVDTDIDRLVVLVPKDSILVVETTQPKFTPLCKKVIGIITDEGGILSHAAILAREFGIPCVVGTRIATQQLHTGDWVKMNGTTGDITVLRREDG